ncbi:MAG: DUF58 domain-containing protein [Defluviitaleaceae bacterium]|nr:DUF58 domain-containing protein [Defluviitaleaceae bacterium]
MRKLFVNRFVWVVILLGVVAGAYFSGERIMFVSAFVLVVLPMVSYAAMYFLLRGLRVSVVQPASVMKGAEATLLINVHNTTFVPLSGVDVTITRDEDAIIVSDFKAVDISPFGTDALEIPFEITYRGHYDFGLNDVFLMDFTGLFRLRRRFSGDKTITALPQVTDISHFPLTMNLMTQASSRYDIRDEDYSTISDIRQYLPTDSIKRVHWKLTAKRNEWLVKNFSSNALNLVSIILDSTRLNLDPREAYALEDALVENAISIAKFCINKNMPVDFLTAGQKVAAKSPADFDVIYQNAARLQFSSTDCHSTLAHELNEATGFVNAVIITTNLTAPLYEKIISGTNNGHYIAVMYFQQPIPSEESEKIYEALASGNMPCFLRPWAPPTPATF